MGKPRDKRDIYYRKAKEEGWRARSAFKLLQLDEQFDLFSGVRRAVDLCAAPGSWSQVLSRRLLRGAPAADRADVRIVAVDLQEMAPIEGVHLIAGDITSQATVDEVLAQFREGDAERFADLVVCDGAPDVSGMHDLDEYIQAQLLLSALSITTQLLRTGGTFVAKIFRSRNTSLLYAQLRIFFPDVYIAKPSSSRTSSVEAFVVARGFVLPEGFERGHLQRITTDNYSSALMAASECGGGGGGGALCASVDGRDGGCCDPPPPPAAATTESAELSAESAELSADLARLILPFVACGDLSGYDADITCMLEAAGEPPDGMREPAQTPISPTTAPLLVYRAYLEAQRATTATTDLAPDIS